MLYLVSFIIYCYLFYRTFKDTNLLMRAKVDKSLNILSYYYLICERRFVFICNILMILFILRTPFIQEVIFAAGAGCLLVYTLTSLMLFIESSKRKYNKDGVKIGLSLFLKTYRFLEYNIGYDRISYKGEIIYFNSISFVFLCFLWELYLRNIKKKSKKEKEIKLYKLIISDLQKEKERLRDIEMEKKTEVLNTTQDNLFSK